MKKIIISFLFMFNFINIFAMQATLKKFNFLKPFKKLNFNCKRRFLNRSCYSSIIIFMQSFFQKDNRLKELNSGYQIYLYSISNKICRRIENLEKIQKKYGKDLTQKSFNSYYQELQKFNFEIAQNRIKLDDSNFFNPNSFFDNSDNEN